MSFFFSSSRPAALLKTELESIHTSECSPFAPKRRQKRIPERPRNDGTESLQNRFKCGTIFSGSSGNRFSPSFWSDCAAVRRIQYSVASWPLLSPSAGTRAVLERVLEQYSSRTLSSALPGTRAVPETYSSGYSGEYSAGHERMDACFCSTFAQRTAPVSQRARPLPLSCPER